MRVFNAIQQVYLEKHGYMQDLEKSLGKDVIDELLNLNIIVKISGHDSWKFNEENTDIKNFVETIIPKKRPTCMDMIVNCINSNMNMKSNIIFIVIFMIFICGLYLAVDFLHYNKTTKNIIKANALTEEQYVKEIDVENQILLNLKKEARDRNMILTGKQYVKEIDVEKYQILLNVKKEAKDRNMISTVNTIDQYLLDGVVTNEEFNKIEDQFNKDVEASRAAGYKVMINEIKSEISKIK